VCRVSDCEAPAFSSTVHRRARKLYACYECGSDIFPGTRYSLYSGKSADGYFFEYKLCLDCDAWSDAFVAAQREHCDESWGWVMGELWAEIADFIEEHFGYARRQRTDGNVLMEAVHAPAFDV